jgi:GAF domain-containing protein
MSEDLKAAVAAGVVGSQESFQTLLQSVVEVARAIFHAEASSIFLLDEESDELVFEAIAGHGAEKLSGQRFPSSTGIAGWVLVTRQPIVIEDVTEDPRFAKDVAETTGYVPKGLMAEPLLHEERALGVLEVLDRPQRTQFSLVEMDLLGLFANQAAIAPTSYSARAEPRPCWRRAGRAPTSSLALLRPSTRSRTSSGLPA